MEKITSKFYNTRLGGLYLDFLLWWDYKFGKDAPFRSAPNFTAAQIVRNAQVLAYSRGIKKIKNKIQELVASDSKKDYNKVLNELQDLIELAKEEDVNKISRVEMLRKQYVYYGGKDIKSSTEKAKMIQKRIEDYKELQNYNLERQLLKEIRKASKNGQSDKVKELKKEWELKYGRFKRSRRC